MSSLWWGNKERGIGLHRMPVWDIKRVLMGRGWWVTANGSCRTTFGDMSIARFSGWGSDLFLDALLCFLQRLSSLYYLNSSTYFPFLFLYPLENSTSQTRRKHMNTLIGGTKKKKTRQYIHLAMRTQRLVNHLQLCFHLLLGSIAGSEGMLFMCTQTCVYLSTHSSWVELSFHVSVSVTVFWPVRQWNLGRPITGDLLGVWKRTRVTVISVLTENKQIWVVAPALNYHAAAAESSLVFFKFVSLRNRKSEMQMKTYKESTTRSGLLFAKATTAMKSIQIFQFSVGFLLWGAISPRNEQFVWWHAPHPHLFLQPCWCHWHGRLCWSHVMRFRSAVSEQMLCFSRFTEIALN